MYVCLSQHFRRRFQMIESSLKAVMIIPTTKADLFLRAKLFGGQRRKWSPTANDVAPDRKLSLNWTANDPEPQMIPDVDRKSSRRKTRRSVFLGSKFNFCHPRFVIRSLSSAIRHPPSTIHHPRPSGPSLYRDPWNFSPGWNLPCNQALSFNDMRFFGFRIFPTRNEGKCDCSTYYASWPISAPV